VLPRKSALGPKRYLPGINEPTYILASGGGGGDAPRPLYRPPSCSAENPSMRVEAKCFLPPGIRSGVPPIKPPTSSLPLFNGDCHDFPPQPFLFCGRPLLRPSGKPLQAPSPWKPRNGTDPSGPVRTGLPPLLPGLVAAPPLALALWQNFWDNTRLERPDRFITFVFFWSEPKPWPAPVRLRANGPSAASWNEYVTGENRPGLVFRCFSRIATAAPARPPRGGLSFFSFFFFFAVPPHCTSPVFQSLAPRDPQSPALMRKLAPPESPKTQQHGAQIPPAIKTGHYDLQEWPWAKDPFGWESPSAGAAPAMRVPLDDYFLSSNLCPRELGVVGGSIPPKERPSARPPPNGQGAKGPPSGKIPRRTNPGIPTSAPIWKSELPAPKSPEEPASQVTILRPLAYV